ncbi:MAG: MAPEG family protein [Proteobacteria bacterium]|nr:MAPEG family protein [Pseudomonadota bacterium]
MEAIVIVTVLALIQFTIFSFQVGKMRMKHEVKAPATTGHADFERMFRVHQNTMEQLVIFVPALWLFGYFVDSLWGAGIGVVFIAGRMVYRAAYLKDPSTRSVGFGLGLAANVVLLIGALIAAVMTMI